MSIALESEIKKNSPRDGHVQLDNALKSVKLDLNIHNRDFFDLLAKHDTKSARVTETERVIELGTFVTNKVQMVMDTDYFDRRVAEMTLQFHVGLEHIQSQLVDTVDQRFDPSKSGSFSGQINQFFAEKKSEMQQMINSSLQSLTESDKQISEKIDQNFNPDLKTSHIGRLGDHIDKFKSEIQQLFDINLEGSITKQIDKMLDETLGADGQLLKSMDRRFSFDNPESVLAVLQKNLMDKLSEIKSEIAAGKSAAEAEKAVLAKSTQKGYSFEELLMENLESFAKQRGDLVENLTQKTGDVNRSKKGDFVYQVNSIKKVIAIEAKDTKMAVPIKVIELLEQTKINRKADYVLYISAEEAQLHNQVGSFQEYPDGKIITHIGLLDVALKVAISRLMIENNEIEGIDRNSVETEITNIKNAISSFRSVKTSATTIIKEAQKIQDQADTIKGDIQSSVSSLSDLLLSQ